eukprot:6492384-Amphidinium_carterae.15
MPKFQTTLNHAPARQKATIGTTAHQPQVVVKDESPLVDKRLKGIKLKLAIKAASESNDTRCR